LLLVTRQLVADVLRAKSCNGFWRLADDAIKSQSQYALLTSNRALIALNSQMCTKFFERRAVRARIGNCTCILFPESQWFYSGSWNNHRLV